MLDIEERFESFYQTVYSKLMFYSAIPAVLIIISVGLLGFSTLSTGTPVELGTDFTGGTEIIFDVEESFSVSEVENAFSESGRNGANAVRQVTRNSGEKLIVQLPPPSMNRTRAEQIMSRSGYNVEIQSFRSLSSSVSDQFFQQAGLAFVLAFSIMSTVIFTAFKDFAPAVAVVFAAASDIIVALAGMYVLSIPLTLGTLAALLMLVGYSVDTDIVLSSRVLKRERGSTKENIYSAIKTGSTMSLGGVIVFSILLGVSITLVGVTELSNIAAVMVIGLVADLPITWLGNSLILKKYENGKIGELAGWK